MKNSIDIKNVTKKYNAFELKNVNMEIPKGCIMGLIGENGAGKTTLIKLILNLIPRDGGTIKVFDKDNIEQQKSIKEDVGVVLDNAFFADLFTALDIEKVLKSSYQHWDSQLYHSYLEKWNLPPKQKIKNYSKGMKVKLQVAVALSHHAKLLILDEPTSGLDPVARSSLLDVFLEFIQDEEHSILFSTHITSDLEHIADYITFINEGSIVLSTSRDKLLEEYGIVRCSLEQLEKIDHKDIIKYKKNRYNCDVLIENKKSFQKKYKGYKIDPVTLDEIMILYVKGELL